MNEWMNPWRYTNTTHNLDCFVATCTHTSKFNWNLRKKVLNTTQKCRNTIGSTYISCFYSGPLFSLGAATSAQLSKFLTNLKCMPLCTFNEEILPAVHILRNSAIVARQTNFSCASNWPAFMLGVFLFIRRANFHINQILICSLFL